MGRYDNLRHTIKGTFGSKRFVFHHIKERACNRTFLYSPGKGLFIQKTPPACIEELTAFFHEGQDARIDNMLGIR